MYNKSVRVLTKDKEKELFLRTIELLDENGYSFEDIVTITNIGRGPVRYFLNRIKETKNIN